MERLIDVAQLEGWIPARVLWQEGEPLIDWCFAGEKRFSESYFNDTLNKCIELPFNLLFRHQTSMETLRRLHGDRQGLGPTGFIFHLSRSGSTLVSQMLAALPANIVLSEAPPIDSVLRSRRFEPSISDTQRIEWLQLIISCLAQARRGNERHLFIKFDSWNIFDLPLIRRAFPAVPWVFVYRDPTEVLASHLQQRGAHMVPGVIDPGMFEMDATTVFEMEPEVYCARVLKALCEAALKHLPDGGLLINYSQLPAALSMISEFFGVSWSAAEQETMMAVTARYAKNSAVLFTNLTATTDKCASARLSEAAQTWVYPAYNALEEARNANC